MNGLKESEWPVIPGIQLTGTDVAGDFTVTSNDINLNTENVDSDGVFFQVEQIVDKMKTELDKSNIFTTQKINESTLIITGNSANDFTITSESGNVNISNIPVSLDIPGSLEIIKDALNTSDKITNTSLSNNKLILTEEGAGDFTLTSNDITFNALYSTN